MRSDIVLANPPFEKSSICISTNDSKMAEKDGYFLREDFWVTTSNKQLSFIQHIINMLEEEGRAGVVLPDNVLFEGGAGELILHKLFEEIDLHAILRLPTGIFYAQDVNVNVLFFNKKRVTKKGKKKFGFSTIEPVYIIRPKRTHSHSTAYCLLLNVTMKPKEKNLEKE